MFFSKNKLVIIIIWAILAGGFLGLYLSDMKKSENPKTSVTSSSSWSGADTQKVGEVIQKLNDLTND